MKLDAFICIVGYGRMGKLYLKNLKDQGYHRFCIIDHDPVQLSCHDRWLLGSLVDLWIVTNPTCFHWSTVEFISTLPNKAPILLEKPYCHPRERSQLAEFARLHPKRCFFSDIYGLSPLGQHISQAINQKRIVRISIEFSKNRQADEANGRFVDEEFGILGYEWFHILSLLKRILGDGLFQAYAKAETKDHMWSSPKLTECTYFSEHGRCRDLPEVQLTTSIAGELFWEDRSFIDACYSAHPLYDDLLNRRIPQDSAFKFRYVRIELEDGSCLYLVYEPYPQVNPYYKNIHSLLLFDRSKRLLKRTDYNFNQMSSMLKILLSRGGDEYAFYDDIVENMCQLQSQMRGQGHAECTNPRQRA